MLRVMAFCHLQENLVIKMVLKILNTTTKGRADAGKTASKRIVKKNCRSYMRFNCKEIADKITLVDKTKSKAKEDETNKKQEIYVPTE